MRVDSLGLHGFDHVDRMMDLGEIDIARSIEVSAGMKPNQIDAVFREHPLRNGPATVDPSNRPADR